MADLQMDRVTLQDGQKLIYKDLSFAVEAGQIGVIYGPSRTGKSSVLLLASGHLPPHAGTIRVNGRAPDRKRAGLGPIHDLTPLFDTLTVEEQIVFQARLYKVRQAKQRTDELIAQYQLQEVRKYRIKDIGHIEQFRVGLVSAVVHRPDVILLDEPERGLTNEEWELARRDLRHLAEEGHVVLITTVLQQVADAGDVVVQLPSGEVMVR